LAIPIDSKVSFAKLADVVMGERLPRLGRMTLRLVNGKLTKDSFEMMKGSIIVFPSVNVESILCTERVELYPVFPLLYPGFHGENTVRPGINK
jgi:hypothetical protein